MPDAPSARDDAAALRAANSRLREVVESKDTEISVLRAQVEACGARVEALSARVAELKARPGQNPRNSSEPPSGEGLGKPAPKSLCQKSGRKPGRPKGQPGATLPMSGHPGQVVTHGPGRCGGCGEGLSGAPVTGTGRRQVIGLPENIRAVVTGHRIVSRRCSCGEVTCGTAPAQASAPVCYGPRLSAPAAYLRHGQFLSRDRTVEAVSELFGVPVSPGAVAGMVRRIAGKPGGSLEAIRAALSAAAVLHAGETGFRVAGKLARVHSASSGKYVLVTVHARRGRQAMDAAGVIPSFTGVLVHGAWAPYDTYDQATRALRNAHVLRELQAIIDAAGDAAWCRAAQAADALRDMKHLADASLAEDGTLSYADQDKLAEARTRYHSAALTGSNQAAARAGPLTRKHHALARRLPDREDDYLRFTADPEAAFDNNRAERDIRMSRLRIKVSGCMRSMTGAEQFCAIRSYLAATAKHGIGKLDALTRLPPRRD